MEEISTLTSKSGTSIQAILPSTFKIFTPHLLSHASAIHSISSKTESYGPHPRQELDIYLPSPTPKGTPILIFFHGGGLIRGDKISPQIPQGLVYHNVGSFFALKGITTIIPNYRRVNSPFGGEDAVFPSGGEDVSLVLKWLEGSDVGAGEGKRDVYLVGNSAGGVHVSTFLFEDRFLTQRKELLGSNNLSLKGVVEVAVPFHFQEAEAGRNEVLEAYYGTPAQIEQRCVYGLLQALQKSGKSRSELAVPKALALLGEFDPVDEIGKPMEDFVALWKETWGEGLEFRTLEGHNHISPPLALMSGDAKGEKWGEDVAKWILES